jgi:hypothetical protein
MVKYQLDDIVIMKKPHPCSSRSIRFKIIRLGADIKIRCLGCGNVLMMTRDHFNQKLKVVETIKI